MLRRIVSIAANTFRETIRNKILYAILAFALFVIGMTFFLADLSVGDFARIIADVGLASIHVFGVIMAVFLGINLVSNEVDRKRSTSSSRSRCGASSSSSGRRSD